MGQHSLRTLGILRPWIIGDRDYFTETFDPIVIEAKHFVNLWQKIYSKEGIKNILSCVFRFLGVSLISCCRRVSHSRFSFDQNIEDVVAFLKSEYRGLRVRLIIRESWKGTFIYLVLSSSFCPTQICLLYTQREQW